MRIKNFLRSEGSVPYLIPVGGSNTVGVWGYIEAFKELLEQVSKPLVYVYMARERKEVQIVRQLAVACY